MSTGHGGRLWGGEVAVTAVFPLMTLRVALLGRGLWFPQVVRAAGKRAPPICSWGVWMTWGCSHNEDTGVVRGCGVSRTPLSPECSAQRTECRCVWSGESLPWQMSWKDSWRPERQARVPGG